MSICVLERLTPSWYTFLTKHSIYIARVYDTHDATKTIEPHPYKFFTVMNVVDKTSNVLGLTSPAITARDIKAMSKALRKVGVTKAHYTHKLRKQTILI